MYKGGELKADKKPSPPQVDGRDGIGSSRCQKNRLESRLVALCSGGGGGSGLSLGGSRSLRGGSGLFCAGAAACQQRHCQDAGQSDQKSSGFHRFFHRTLHLSLGLYIKGKHSVDNQ